MQKYFSHSFVLDSPLPPSEVHARLTRLLEPRRSFIRRRVHGIVRDARGVFGRPRYFDGPVSPNSFALSPAESPRGIMIVPVVLGSIRPREGGSEIVVTVAPETPLLVLQAFVTLLLGVLAVYVAVQTSSLPHWWWVVFLLLAIGVIPWPLSASLSKEMARHIRPRLAALLDAPYHEA